MTGALLATEDALGSSNTLLLRALLLNTFLLNTFLLLILCLLISGQR